MFGKVLKVALVMGLMIGTTGFAVAEKRPKKKENQSVTVLDSTEAQWGMRSINDSVYRGYTVNAVYLERGRQRLPDSFKMYHPTPVGVEGAKSETEATPTTIRVNGKDQKLAE